MKTLYIWRLELLLKGLRRRMNSPRDRDRPTFYFCLETRPFTLFRKRFLHDIREYQTTHKLYSVWFKNNTEREAALVDLITKLKKK